MALKAMEKGKHAFIEVSPAVTVDQCWQLVDMAEKTQRHCSIIENCCYGDEELFVLNLARQGFFGDLKHTPSAPTSTTLAAASSGALVVKAIGAATTIASWMGTSTPRTASARWPST
jgi:predicted dehydrogenase